MVEKEITLNVNGKNYRFLVSPGAMLADVLRDQLRLTGTKVGCGSGECGACTVLIEGKPFASCLVPALRTNGKRIMTVEGLCEEGRLHPLQESFIKSGAVQCGFCTPGMLISAKALLDRNPKPTLPEIQDALSGNLCRCGGYQLICDAILKAAGRLQKRSASPSGP